MKLLGRAYSLAPQERSVALLYAEAKLRNGESAEAAALLEPFAPNESDVAFLDTFADACSRPGNSIAHERFWKSCYAKRTKV